MKKTNWSKILNITFIVIAALFAFAIISLGFFNKKPISEVRAELVNGMPFKVGVVNRQANNYSDGQFSYLTNEPFNGEIRTVAQDEYVMLNNYNVQNRLSDTQIGSSQPVENLYIAIGEKDKKDGVILTGLHLTVTLNGEQISNVGTLNPYVEGDELNNGCYYFAYLDAKNFGEGYYTFSFRYNYQQDGEYYPNKEYSYSFYLMDQSSYSTYPQISNAQSGNPFNKKIQYFYNYTVNALPTYTFDAYHYNISYVRTKNNETENVTTSFVLNGNDTGTLTIVSSIKGTTSIIVPKTSDEVYNVTLSFDDLGTYEFTNRYQVKTVTGFNIIENILAYDVKQSNPVTGLNDYEEGNLQKGFVRLHIFGVKAYFTKGGKGLELKNENVSSDKTNLIYNTLYLNTVDSNFGFANTILNNNDLSANQKAYPVTNLAPIYFDYYGKFSFNATTPISRYKVYSDANFSKQIKESYLTKDSNLEGDGYYELIFEYTYDSYDVTDSNNVTNGASFAQRQAFMFRIDNSAPTVDMFSGETVVDNVLIDRENFENESFTNKYVAAQWPTTNYFQAEISAEIFKYSYNGELLNTSTYTALSPIGTEANPNGNYILRVYFTESKAVYVEYSFVIDKDPIQDITFKPIDAVYSSNSTNPTGFRIVNDTNTVNFENKTLINQPFTFTYSQKQSGAKITTKYYKIPFSSNTVTNHLLNQAGFTYVINNYAIDPLNSSTADYALNYNSIANGVVDADNAFNEDNSYIYFFDLIDAAGNKATKYIIYDLTKPYIIVDASTLKEGINEIDNAYNIVNEEAQVIWGNYKAVPVNTTTNETINSILNNIFENESNLFKTLNGKTYMCSPITRLSFENKTDGKFLTLQNTSIVSDIILYPVEPSGANAVQKFFSGEASYGYTVTDSSHIQSLTSIARNNSITNSIWMNLDNAMGIAYGNYSTSLNDIGEPINTKAVTNSNQLRFTYLPGEGNFAVKSVTYRYYKFNPSNFGEIENDYLNDYIQNIKDGEPYSVYPYEKDPSIDFNLGKIIIDTKLNIVGDSDRVVSDVINPINENNTVVTRPGMYVIRREYAVSQEALGDSLDTAIRYYYYFVDRTGIISINTGSDAPADTNIYQDDEADISNKMLYQTGAGILFNFGKSDNGNFDTYYTAKQIQQYLAFSSNTSANIFDSNKLSIYLNLPIDKFNTKLTLDRATAAASQNLTNYINAVESSNNYSFNLKYNIVYDDELGSKTTIVDTTDPTNHLINLDYFENVGFNQYVFKNAGIYKVTLYDSADARLSKPSEIDNQLNTKLEFNFKISHEAPNGNYYSKYNDQNKTPMLLQQKSENLVSNGDGTESYETIFKSINNNSLSFSFDKTSDKYRAEVDPTNISVTRTVNGSTSTIYSRVNQPVDNQILVENPTGYTLTIFDEDDYINEGKAYIGGTGDNRDYILAQTNNITYTVKLQYIGNKNDYDTERGLNFFSKTFKITLDRIKPQYNYSQLIVNDNLKYGASNNVNINMEQYYFAVNNNFIFKQNEALGYELDSAEIFVRHLTGKSSTNDFPEYYKTLTPDDENYYLDTLPNNIRFSEANPEFVKSIYDGSTHSILPIDMFYNGSGYYEIIERDEAQNYRVYVVQYFEPSVETAEITYEYTPAKLGDGNETIQGVINKTTNSQAGGIQVLGKDLKIINISAGTAGTNDYFYKCDISYNNQVQTVYNNPNDRADSTSWADFINLINNRLSFTNESSKTGYSITLRFYNRFTDLNGDYVVTYNIPGERLQPIITDNAGGTSFTLTIPNDMAGTYIKGFIADKFENGTWVRLSQDSLGSTIITNYSDNSSLQGLTYTFGLGEYRFQLIDNFNRGDLTLDPKSAFFKGLGVNDVNSLTFNNSQVVDNITYTANNVQLTYQTNLYALTVEVLNENGTYTLIPESEFRNNNIIDQGLNNGVQTLIFANVNKNTDLTYRLTLLIEKADSSTVYNFCITRKLPEIELRNLSGGKISTSQNVNDPTIHTENFTVNWEVDAFNPSVSLRRVYTDSEGKQQTENINNIANGYQVNLPGTYTASITNSLGYTDSSKNIYFKLTNGEIVVYDVVAIDSLVEKVIQPSPVTSTIIVDGVQKILYRYYALSSFNNDSGSNKYIEIRVNKNKGLESTLLNTSTETNKQYKIYGTSNYGYERYIEIVYIDEFVNGLTDSGRIDVGFTDLTIGVPQIVNGVETDTLTSLEIDKEITSVANSVTLSWNPYYIGNGDPNMLSGNIIYADYYFNGTCARTISSLKKEKNIFTIKTAGIHSFEFYDLAGNIQKFNGSNRITINLVNDVLFTVNSNNPINNQIYNGEVILEIINRHLYSADPTITAKLNGNSIEVEKIGTSFYQYRFVNQGYYEVTLSTRVNTGTNNANDEISTTYCFTIINPNQALPCFNVPQNANFRVVTVLKEAADITYSITNLNELWISPATLGTGNYTITLSKYQEELGKTLEFTFKVWINNEVPYIISSIPFGTGTTSKITITYNPKIIYDQVGESYILITGYAATPINAESPNEVQTVVLDRNQTYYIQIFTKDDKLINSYKVIKNEPLNTTAIIIIVVASVVVVALIVVFIVIRVHLKFR